MKDFQYINHSYAIVVILDIVQGHRIHQSLVQFGPVVIKKIRCENLTDNGH